MNKRNFVISVITVVLVSGCLYSGWSALSNLVFEHILKTILIIALSYVVFEIIKSFIDLILKSELLNKRSDFILNNKSAIIKRFNWFAGAGVILLSFSQIATTWGLYNSVWHAAEAILKFGFKVQNISITVGHLLLAGLMFYFILCLSWAVRTFLESDFYPKRDIDPGVGFSINRLIYYSFVCVGIAVVMGILGISYQSLMVVIGALGVGIGFGLQNIVNNFASGLILLFERSIKVGDTVVVGGTLGTVKYMGLRATVIQTSSNVEMIVPNSDLVSSVVNNWTMSNKKTRFTIKVGVAYGSDPEKVKKILLEIANAHKNVLQDPAPAVIFAEFGDSSLNFELRCWVADIKNHWNTQDDLMYEIERKFKENDIEIPFPQQDLYIKSMPEVKIKN